jgi:predicted subunit of tRNA(5-methylaminomethyl-2-thiouridylate) methyltransferase
MNAYTKEQAKEIQYIVKLLALDTKEVDDVLYNIKYIRRITSSLLVKCDIIETEMYALTDESIEAL